MAQNYDLVIRGGVVVNHDGVGPRDIGIRKGRIVALGALPHASAERTIDATGLHVLPGVIDSQVHFREPGNAHKEDLESGSRSAVLGGVTGVFDMPNNTPPIIDANAMAAKSQAATGRMFCDFAFYAGATGDNNNDLAEMERMPGCCGVKVFMGSSTGSLLVAEDAALTRVLETISRRAAFHSEDEARLIARSALAEPGKVETHAVWRDAETALTSTRRLLSLAREAGKRVHVLHITTAEEMDLLMEHKDIASVEVTPQHLTLTAPECYARLGTRAQMNPPLRDEAHTKGLWRGLQNGVVDVIGSDHAPHTLEEKSQEYPASPSGMPGVQTLVPVMLTHVAAGRLSLERFVDLTSHGVGRLFGLVRKGRIASGYDADFTLVDLKAERVIEDSWIASRCGWTPYAGFKATGWPKGTIIRGRTVMWEDEIQGAANGAPMRFMEALR